MDYNRDTSNELVPRCILEPAQYRYLCISVQRDGRLMYQVRSRTRGQSPTLQWRYIYVGPHSLIAFGLRRYIQASGAPDVTIRDNLTQTRCTGLWRLCISLLYLLGNAEINNVPCYESQESKEIHCGFTARTQWQAFHYFRSIRAFRLQNNLQKQHTFVLPLQSVYGIAT